MRRFQAHGWLVSGCIKAVAEECSKKIISGPFNLFYQGGSLELSRKFCLGMQELKRTTFLLSFSTLWRVQHHHPFMSFDPLFFSRRLSRTVPINWRSKQHSRKFRPTPKAFALYIRIYLPPHAAFMHSTYLLSLLLATLLLLKSEFYLLLYSHMNYFQKYAYVVGNRKYG